MNRLLLLDGNAIIHRAYHALPPLTSSTGQQVNAVYGFASMVLRLEHDLRPYAMAVAFDRPAPTFRKNLYANYQKTRPKMDDTLVQQIPLVHDLVSSFGIPFFEKDGFEADDVIGTIIQSVKNSPDIQQSIIVTGDRDLLQLVSDDRVLVYMPTKGLSEAKLYGEKEVTEKMGVTPKQIVDLKALIGDSSDNYPGIAGIGPKTAVGLLQSNKTVEDIYKALAENKVSASPAVLEKLNKGKDDAFLSYTLATIRTDVPLSIEIPSLEPIKSRPQARKFLESMHFHSLLGRMDGVPKHSPKPHKAKKETIEKASEQQSLFDV